MFARGLQVEQARHLAAQAVEVVDAQGDAEATCNSDEVNDCVGGAADGRECADGVFERLAGQDLGDGLVFVHHLDDAPPGVARQHVTATVHGRVGGVARQADA